LNRKPNRDRGPAKERVDFRKNRGSRQRRRDFTEASDGGDVHPDELTASERLSGKGSLTRRRTVVREPLPTAATGGSLPVGRRDDGAWPGRVLEVRGLDSLVESAAGRVVRCVTSRLLKTVATDQRHVVTAGDRVWVRGGETEGMIEAVEPRQTELSRTSRGRRHAIVANVDQVVIVASAAEPRIKPGLIDRFIVAAECNGILPVVVINKTDLVDPAGLVPLAGVYARIGYPVILASTASGMGIERLESQLHGKITAFVGQSGVGKSSLLNRIAPDLDLRTAAVSDDNEKGRHTTTTARLIPLPRSGGGGGHVVDTPGIRQLQLWEVVAAEVPAAFRDVHPFANHCRYPDCSHTHEDGCGVKDAVADGLLDTRRWESCSAMIDSADTGRGWE
jgi:ribosome biogenesis GTPase / thiamine phosphate phosphatase